MIVLFIHQNFPGQFLHLAQALARHGHEVHALGITPTPVANVRVHTYSVKVPQLPPLPFLADLPAKFVRGHACLDVLIKMRSDGFNPDLVIGHPGWGETIFAKDVWPEAKHIAYLEFFYRSFGQDCGFDPEFTTRGDPTKIASRIRLRNAHQLLALDAMDAGLSPTTWQRSTYPAAYQSKIEVIFDGVDTTSLKPNLEAQFKLPDGTLLAKEHSEVITFVNRNLEPYRGYHIFMRALPALLLARPNAQVVIVGGDGVSYGSAPSVGKSWKQIFLNEVAGKLDLNRVHFVGRVPRSDLTSLLQVSSCHVYLTYPFVLSWSLIEAMSAGCAIVASDCAPVREVVNHSEHGLLFDFFDSAALAGSVIKILESPQLGKSLGDAARRRAVGKYDLNHVCLDKQLAFIEKVLARELSTQR